MKTAARKALARGDVAEALALWQDITAGDASPADLVEHAVLLHQLYRSREARSLWHRLLEHPAALSPQLLTAAKLEFQLGRFAESAHFTGRAVEIEPDSPDIAAMHAASLERAGDTAAAETRVRDMLEKHPHHVRLVRLLARILRRGGHFLQAKDRLQAHLGRFPSNDDWRLRYELAAVLDRLGESDEAMRQLDLAKQQLAPSADLLKPAWRAMTDRQWDVTRLLSADRLSRWSTPEVSPAHPPLCLMAGFPRSGTTLLEQMVTNHPDCIGTDESGILATQFRDPLVFGAASAEEVLAELDGFEPDDLEAGRAEYFRCTADVLGEETGTRLLIEKDPLLTADLAIPLRLFPAAKILMPLRDPRDVVISFYFTIVPGAPNSVAAASLEDSCRYYAEVMRHWLLLRERLDPARWMESRYEDLLADPEAQTRRIATFLDLPWRQEMLAHTRREPGKAVGTPSYDDVSKPLYTRSMGRWQRYASTLEPHLHHLEPYLQAFGYQ